MTNHSEKIALHRSAIAASATKIQMDLETIRDPVASLSCVQFLLNDVYWLAKTIHDHVEQIDYHLDALALLEAEHNQEVTK